jgi:hypothetical protein
LAEIDVSAGVVIWLTFFNKVDYDADIVAEEAVGGKN